MKLTELQIFRLHEAKRHIVEVVRELKHKKKRTRNEMVQIETWLQDSESRIDHFICDNVN
jgi:predicted nucleic-acid-binding protein